VGLRELLENEQLPRIISMPPTIIKPQRLWTGKQAISTILKNIVVQEDKELKEKKLQGLNLDSKSKLPASEWGPFGKEEGDVIFRDNELL
jgi:DNA-directed RNA polymerase I subunit RPA1